MIQSPLVFIGQLLAASPAVVAALGGQPKIYSFDLPQAGTPPSIRLLEISSQPLGETLKAMTEPAETRISVECHGSTPSMADDVAEPVLAALEGFMGTIGEYRVQGVYVVSDTVLYDDTTRVTMRILDFRVYFGRA